RTRLVDGNLRFFRTMLLGRAPGFAQQPAAVGPWRPVELVRRRILTVEELSLRASLDGDGPQAAGRLQARALLRPLAGARIDSAELELVGPSGSQSVALAVADDAAGTTLAGTLDVPGVARWWPHTHGEPALYQV